MRRGLPFLTRAKHIIVGALAWTARITRRALAWMTRATLRLVDAVISAEGAFVAGMALLAYGLSLVYRPAAFIAPCAILIAIAVFGVRRLGDR
jgi:hypothetical protein